MTAFRGFGNSRGEIPHIRLDIEKSIEEYYTFGKQLGKGAFGTVFSALSLKDNTTWAVKVVNREQAGSARIKLLEREISILKRVSHEHIILLKEVFEAPLKVYLVFELCTGGELAQIVTASGPLSESVARDIIRNIASAVAYLHMHEIVHRDLKLENILVQRNPADENDMSGVKLTDFGLSVIKGVGVENLLQCHCGTPIYMSPEILGNKSYSQQCDIWALGVIMFALLSGSFPFREPDEEKLKQTIQNSTISFSNDTVWSTISDDAKTCLRQCLEKDPARRLSASELLTHAWITGDRRPTMNVLDMMRSFRLEQDEVRRDEQRPNTASRVPQAVKTKSGAKAKLTVNDTSNNKRTPSAPETSRGGGNPSPPSRQAAANAKRASLTTKLTTRQQPTKP